MEKLKSNEYQNYNVMLLIFLNLLLALVAFIKDVVFASYFGTSKVGDAISIAFFIPDMIGNNLIGAALAVSCIPIFTKLSVEKDDRLYKETLSITLLLVLLSTCVISVLLGIFSKTIFQLFNVFNESTNKLIINYFIAMLPIIIFAPLWLMGSAIMQSSRKFIIPGVTPILINLVLLLSLIWSQWKGIPLIKGGFLFSLSYTCTILCVGLLTWFLLWKVQKLSLSFYPLRKPWEITETRNISRVFGGYFLILMFNQLCLFVERMYAGFLETGTISALTYAYRISQFPLWVFVAAINTYILPTISFHLANKDITAMRRDLLKSFTVVIGISALISFLLVYFSEFLLKVTFVRGAFTEESLDLTSTILKSYGLSIVGQSLYVFCTRYYVAENQMKFPLLIGVIGSCINIVLLVIMVPSIGAAGIGYAVTIASTISGGILLWNFIYRLNQVERKGGVSYE